MRTATGNDFGHHLRRVYEQHHARLRHYFLSQLGASADADGCVQETVYRLFVFMRGRRPADEAAHVSFHLMRAAAALRAEKLAEKNHPADAREQGGAARPRRGDTDRAIRAIRERLLS